MALTKSILTGRVVLPTDAALINAELVFTLSGLDSEGGDILPPGDPARCVLINGELPPGYSIWRNTEGYRGTHYIVTVMWTDMTRQGIRETIRELGKIQVGDNASYVLADLLAEGTVPAGETFWSAITEAEYDAVIDAAASAAAAAESMTAVMDFVTVAAEPIWASSRMKFVTDAGQWWAKRVNLMVVGGQSNRVRYSITPGAGESQGNVFVWNGSAWLVATPALIGDITYVEAHRVSLVEGRPVFVVHGAVAGTAIARWVPGGDLFDALKASAIAAMADLASRGYQISRRVYDFSQGEGEYDLAPLHSLSTFRYPAFINGVRGADYLGSGCQIIITELLRQSMGGTTDRVNREWQRLISAGYTGVHLAPSDGLATEDPTDGSVQVVHFNPAGRIEMGLRCADIQLGLSNGVTSGDVAGRITATTERIWKERAYTWLGVINIGAGNVNNQVLNLLTAITGTPILWEVGGVTTEIASGVTASTYTYVGASDTQIVIWGPTDANYDQAMGFSAVATPGQGGIRSFVLNPLAHLASLYISGHSGLMHNVNPSTWGKRMKTFRLDAAPLVTFDSFVAADMPKSLSLLTFTSTTPVPVWVSDAITAENTNRGGTIAVTIGGTPAGFRKANHFSTFTQMTTAIAAGYHESDGQIISIGDAGAQTLYWLIADSAAAGVGGIAPAGWRLADTRDAARIAALEALVVAGVIPKAAVSAATTGNINLAAPGATIDGVTMATSGRFLAPSQSAAAENGIYIFNGPATPATRATDMDTAAEVKGTLVFVSGGAVNAGRWYSTTSTVTTLNTDPIVWFISSDSAFILAQIASITAAATAAAQDAIDAVARASLWDFTADAPDGSYVPAVIAEDGKVLSYSLTAPLCEIDELARSMLWDFTGEVPDGAEIPILVPELDPTKMLFAASMISGSATSTSVIRFMTDDGQSTGEGQAGSSAATIYGTAMESDLLTLRRGALADIFLGMATSGGTSIQLNGSDITSIGPLIPQIASTGTHGTTASEGFARALLKSGSGPIAVLSNAEGGQNITNLLPGAPGGYYAFANITTWMTRAQAVKPSGSRLVYDWLLMDQGQSNTGSTTLGDQHEAYRVAVQTQAQSIFGQTEALRMITWQPSSFHSSSVGVRSILDYALAHADDGLFICGGPTYGLPWSSDFLHNTSLGYAMRGEAAAGIQRRAEETGIYLPLHFISATVTGTNTITAKLSEAAVIDITDAFVASIANYGIEATGGTVTAVTLIGDTAIITTDGAAASVTALKIGLNPQSSPDRLAVNIPRTNLRARAGLGSYSWGGLIKAWACHQQITVS